MAGEKNNQLAKSKTMAGEILQKGVQWLKTQSISFCYFRYRFAMLDD
jgi:hypothetical protein